MTTQPIIFQDKKVYLANPRGFCAGVDRAIAMVEQALAQFGAPIYVRHEIVHNRLVVNELREKGVRFIEDLAEVPPGHLVIFSAHGVSQAIVAEAEARQLKIFDATCPLVSKVHIEVGRYAKEDREVILIGHAGHPEVEGTLGQYHSARGAMYLVQNHQEAETLQVKNPDHLAYVSQTTLSADDTREIIAILRRRFPAILGPKHDDICYATQNRQDAIKTLAKHAQVILVIGSKNSSNSNRLREIAAQQGAKAYLIDDEKAIDKTWFKGSDSIGVTAGASAPEHLVQAVLTWLNKEEFGKEIIELPGVIEDVHFALPKALRHSQDTAVSLTAPADESQ
jgi:4-hydroxy-3-methylbut-2-enyl diphosphate reductase